jgi:hypothetical protein
MKIHITVESNTEHGDLQGMTLDQVRDKLFTESKRVNDPDWNIIKVESAESAEPDLTITANDYDIAIAQNACNAGALVKTLARLVDKLWAEARANSKGTDYVNQHPLMRLHAEQIYFLARRDWSEAMTYCQQKLNELKAA